MTGLGIEKTKGSVAEGKRGVLGLQENMKAKGRYFSGKLLRKNKYIKWVKMNS
jgi:hypothetical protein